MNSGWTWQRNRAQSLARNGLAVALLFGFGCGGKSLANGQTAAAAGAPAAGPVISAAGAGGSSSAPANATPNPEVVKTCETTNAEWCAELASGKDDVVSAIAVDSQGSVLITGYTTGNLAGYSNHGYREVFVAKYTPSGEVIWLREFGADETGYAQGIAIDSNDDIVVAGVRYINEPLQRGFLAKLSSQGDRLWERQSGDEGGSVAVDASGNIVWARGTGEGATLEKYSPAGALLWSKPLGALGGYVAVDPAGEIILSGQKSGTPVAGSGWLEKFAASGDLLWSNQGAIEFSLAHVADSSGDFFVLGYDNRWLVQRNTSDGDLVWSHYADSKLFDETGLAIGPNGDLFIAGMSSNFQMGGYDSYVSKLSSDGEVLGGKALGIKGEDCVLAVGPNEEVYLAGPLPSGAFVARLSL